MVWYGVQGLGIGSLMFCWRVEEGVALEYVVLLKWRDDIDPRQGVLR